MICWVLLSSLIDPLGNFFILQKWSLILTWHVMASFHENTVNIIGALQGQSNIYQMPLMQCFGLFSKLVKLLNKQLRCQRFHTILCPCDFCNGVIIYACSFHRARPPICVTMSVPISLVFNSMKTISGKDSGFSWTDCTVIQYIKKILSTPGRLQLRHICITRPQWLNVFNWATEVTSHASLSTSVPVISKAVCLVPRITW